MVDEPKNATTTVYDHIYIVGYGRHCVLGVCCLWNKTANMFIRRLMLCRGKCQPTRQCALAAWCWTAVSGARTIVWRLLLRSPIIRGSSPAVSYILPDLFREGQGILVEGTLNQNGVFEAVEVLAKHDENYMPPELMDTAGYTNANR